MCAISHINKIKYWLLEKIYTSIVKKNMLYVLVELLYFVLVYLTILKLCEFC